MSLLKLLCTTLIFLFLTEACEAKGLGKKMGSLVKGGGAKKAAAELMKVLLLFPAQMETLMVTLAQTSMAVTQARLVLANPVATPQMLMGPAQTLTHSVFVLQNMLMQLHTFPAFVALKKMSEQCASPTMTVAMALPGVGQVVVGLCGKITASELKVEMKYSQIQATQDSALTAQQEMNTRLNSTPEGQQILMQIMQNEQATMEGLNSAGAAGQMGAAGMMPGAGGGMGGAGGGMMPGAGGGMGGAGMMPGAGGGMMSGMPGMSGKAGKSKKAGTSTAAGKPGKSKKPVKAVAPVATKPPAAESSEQENGDEEKNNNASSSDSASDDSSDSTSENASGSSGDE